MTASELAFVRGLRDTRAALERWNDRPWPVLAEWVLVSGVIAAGLLLAVHAIAIRSAADPTPLTVPGVTREAGLSDVAYVMARNLLVLALHALACVAGFIAGSALPLVAAGEKGVSRWVHERAGPLAIAFVSGATAFSLATQTLVLGAGVASLSAQLGLSPDVLLLALLPHALPELAALFLPLAAWFIASFRDRRHELLAATVVTVALAVPVLLASAMVETFVSPRLLLRLLA